MAHDEDATIDASGQLDATVDTSGVGLEETLETVVKLPGRYRDLGLIGAGSFGEVRRVHDMLLDRVVAMKLLHPEYTVAVQMRRRFLVEATITAQLQHPGIVAVYDRGEHEGRLWFTMQEVRGRTLGSVIDELHAHKTPTTFVMTPSGWTFRRVVDAFARIAQALAYAHSRRIVHRDLKPENLMTGEFGEVLVMDWGLARRITVDETPPGASDASGRRTAGAEMTRYGDVLGTPAFMAPEQARGDSSLHGPGSDIYALGGVLFCLLTGKLPYSGSVQDVLAKLLSGQQPRVSHAAEGGPPLPAELVAACERAMRPEIADRYESADALAADIVAWLDGLRRREQALAALDQARAIAPEIAALRTQAKEAETQARAIQAEIKPFDSVEKKRPAWILEDEALRLGRAAALAETRWTEAVHGALSLDPDLPEAHTMLADHYRERLVEAELAHRGEDSARAEEMLRIHDRGRHVAFLRGEGVLTLMTDPPGAEVIVERFVAEDRRLVPIFEKMLGQTPSVDVPLQRGSYLLRIRAPGCAEVRYPVLMERAGQWDGKAPGEKDARPIVLPTRDELGPNDVYVPPGWAWIGGDPSAADGLPRKRVWVDGFVMQRFSVTVGEYLEFLNDLVANGREQEARDACPKLPSGDESVLPRNDHGLYGLPPEREGLRWRLDWPVALVNWHAAMAYARWLARKTNRAWRLPNELEWEKAARGVDGRIAPWGDHLDATFACVLESHRGAPGQAALDDYPADESVYGIRGLAGHVRNWCINVWKMDGPLVEKDRVLLDPARIHDDDFRIIRGGAWGGTISQSRAAARSGARPGTSWHSVGVRLVRGFPST